MQKKLFAVGSLLFLLLPFGHPLAQTTAVPRPAPPVPASRPATTNPTDAQFGQQRNAQPDPDEVKREKDMEKARNKERFASLKKDTDQLLALATELKKSVDEASENTLSLEVIHKTEEVEKLAKKVREKMKAN
ncbi:MAG: hypothetical protein JWN45_837 [Acidobacteriaceae bacterium]|nr:hypothetical protein [Acidobacteriaceae bacterium]